MKNIKLLRHISSCENESLASYLFRIAAENVCEISWLLSDSLGLSATKTIESINNVHEEKMIKYISEVVDLPIDNIHNMTVNRFSFDLWTPSPATHAGYFFGKMLSYKHSKFCPICLKENAYHRIYWQLGNIKICIKHGTILIEKCIECQNIITISDVILGRCLCGKELSSMAATVCNSQIVIGMNCTLSSRQMKN